MKDMVSEEMEVMTFRTFRDIARDGGYVVWNKTGVVERLKWERGGISAVNPMTGVWHRISTHFGPPGQRKLRKGWCCSQFEMNAYVIDLGTMFEIQKSNRQLFVKDLKRKDEL